MNQCRLGEWEADTLIAADSSHRDVPTHKTVAILSLESSLLARDGIIHSVLQLVASSWSLTKDAVPDITLNTV